MTRLIALTLATFLMVGCEPSFKEEYEAVKQELEATQLALADAQQKLKAADNEIRHKIFTLIRSANNRLQSPDIDLSEINRIVQEMQVHRDSYTQLNTEQDHVAATSEFYLDKLEAVVELIAKSRSTYNRRYNECLAGMEETGGKNDLSGMLCDVQADMAKQALANEVDAYIEALLAIGQKQLKAGRRSNSSKSTIEQLESEFNSLRSQRLKQPS
ncbi:MAG: hypothetical protein OQK12_13685 [Motiliproteus sp.]|nr:hypothetical protein [Motiliproteus sp.]MCW9053931.1 hypothetical protein [Motiliproteus sp.]